MLLFISTFRHLTHLSPPQVPASGANVSGPGTAPGEPFSRTWGAVNSPDIHFREVL